MFAKRLAFLTLILSLVPAMSVQANDWIARSGRYTHDHETGYRVHQYAPTPAVYHRPSQTRSVYRHVRSSLQVGSSVDFYHSVDQYGSPVRPYGEWRFPYRPFSVPYGAWGPQPQPGYGFGYGGFAPGGGGYGFPMQGTGVGSPFGPYGVINGSGFPPPWNDGSYPDVRRRQLPPQPFPGLLGSPQNTINNQVNGNNNVIAN